MVAGSSPVAGFFFIFWGNALSTWPNENICAAIAQSGERQTEDLKVPGSIPGRGIFLAKTVHAAKAKKCICRESNPGRLDGNEAFYH